MTGDNVEMTDKDGLSSLLDLRTASCMHLSGRAGVDLKRFKSLLKDQYVKFGVRAYKWRTRNKPLPESDPESDEGSQARTTAQQKLPTQMAAELFGSDDEVEDSTPATPAKVLSKPKGQKLADKREAKLKEVEQSLQASFSRHHKAYVEQANSIPLTGYRVTVPEERDITW